MNFSFPASLRVISQSFVDWWATWLDLLIVTLIWLFAQVTIFLGPPATFGLYYVAHALVNGESLGTRGLMEGARLYFWKAWLWALINVFVLAVLYANLRFYGQLNASWGIYVQIFTIMLTVLWLAVQFYALPFLMEQSNKSILLALRNGFYGALVTPFFTFVILLVVVVIVLLCVIAVVPAFLGVPALIPILGMRALFNRLEKFGLREREKTPKEIELEESGHSEIPGRRRDRPR